jgi:hypothetical protein
MVKVGAIAHCPESGVNVYVVVAVLFNAGDHVPVTGTASLDDNGNGFRAAPVHIGATAGNVGVTFWFTVIVNVVVFAH